MVRRVTKAPPRSQLQYVRNSHALQGLRDLPGVKPAPFPAYIEPLLATKWERPPPGDQWLHEVKFDGYRLQLHRKEAAVRCYTRRGYDWTNRFPSLVECLWDLKAYRVVIDGEVIVVAGDGATDFSALESYV